MIVRVARRLLREPHLPTVERVVGVEDGVSQGAVVHLARRLSNRRNACCCSLLLDRIDLAADGLRPVVLVGVPPCEESPAGDDVDEVRQNLVRLGGLDDVAVQPKLQVPGEREVLVAP